MAKTRARSHDKALIADAKALYDAMTALLRAYQFRDRDRVGYGNITITQMYVLDCLIRRGEMTLNDLSAALFLDKSTMSRAIDALEAKRLISRKENPGDGRSVLLTTTPAGASARRAVERRIIPENAELLASVPRRARRQLIALIESMTTAASARKLDVVDGDA